MARFGYANEATTAQTSYSGNILGTSFTMPKDGLAINMNVFMIVWDEADCNAKCAIYDDTDESMVAQTEARQLTGDDTWRWETFNFSGPSSLSAGTNYHLVCISNKGNASTDCKGIYDTGTGETSYYENIEYANAFSDPFSETSLGDRSYSIYCTYLPVGRSKMTYLNSSKYNSDDVYVGSQWFDGSNRYRKKITVDGSMISGSHTDFPLLLRIPNDADLTSRARSDGKDIVITTEDGVTRTHCEIDKYLNGSGTVWFRAPTLTDAASSTFYIYYGSNLDHTSDASYKPSGVWDIDYGGVWHLNEIDSVDSTVNANTGSDAGTPLVVGGIVGSGVKFIPTDRIDLGTDDSIAISNQSAFTIEGWVNQTTHGSGVPAHQNWFTQSQGNESWNIILGTYFTDVAGSGMKFIHRDQDYAGPTYDGRDTIPSNKLPSLNEKEWYYIVGTYRSSQSLGSFKKLYINGTVFSSTSTGMHSPLSHIRNGAVTRTSLGHSGDFAPFSGSLDEIRITKGTARNEGWVLTSYRQVSSNSKYVSYGPEESVVDDIFLKVG